MFLQYLNLASIPHHHAPFVSLDMDMTLDCNLACIYCYKEKRRGEISERTAFDAIVWFVYSSGDVKNVSLALMGGEPLLRFELIKKLIPFSKRRMQEHGKNLNVSITTNCTLVTDEVLDFAREWKIGFHTSIDGIPEIQNKNRPRKNGGMTSQIVESTVKKILAYDPTTTARCTLLARDVNRLFDNYLYFRHLGYTSIAIIPTNYPDFNGDKPSIFREQLYLVANEYIASFRNGCYISCAGISDYLPLIAQPNNMNQSHNISRRSCGAGLGMANIDIHGNISPCGRFTGDKNIPNANFGNIYCNFDNRSRDLFLTCEENHSLPFVHCNHCNAQKFCLAGCYSENYMSTKNVFGRSQQACAILNSKIEVCHYIHDVLFSEKCPTFIEHYYPCIGTNRCCNSSEGLKYNK
jgi:uncharacterized protein